mmetsp:Transcript_10052/g.18764  ORF Transcript_10052/g.18764 Transcript_10052/m.18764 type:complete len:234 (-) Transcript_10052:244-945(-)
MWPAFTRKSAAHEEETSRLLLQKEREVLRTHGGEGATRSLTSDHFRRSFLYNGYIFRVCIHGRWVSILIIHVDFSTKHARDSAANVVHAVLDELLSLGCEGSTCTAQDHFVRDDIPGVTTVNFANSQHPRLLGVLVSGDNCLQIGNERRSLHNSVHCAVGSSAMSSFSANFYLEGVTGRHDGPISATNDSKRSEAPQVNTVNGIHLRPHVTAQTPVIDHFSCTSIPLFGRLEN